MVMREEYVAIQAGNGLLCKLACLASEYGNSRNQTATDL